MKDNSQVHTLQGRVCHGRQRSPSQGQEPAAFPGGDPPALCVPQGPAGTGTQ